MAKIILCTDKNYGIGYKNTIPWHSSEDFKHFKEETLNKTVVMGYNTWKSLPNKPLSKRLNIVLVNRAYEDRDMYDQTNVLFLDEDNLESIIRNNPDCVIIGGASIYKMSLPHIDEIVHSIIPKEFVCDCFFDFTIDKRVIIERESCKTLDDGIMVDYYKCKPNPDYDDYVDSYQ